MRWEQDKVAQVPVAFFGWTTALDKLLTIGNLSRRETIIVIRCYVCKISGELDRSSSMWLLNRGGP